MQAGPSGRLRAGQLGGVAPGRGKRVPRPPPHSRPRAPRGPARPLAGVHLQPEGGEERGAPGPRPPARGAGSGQRRAAPRGGPRLQPAPSPRRGPWGPGLRPHFRRKRGALSAEPPLPAAFPSFPAARRGPGSGCEHHKTVAGPPGASGSLGAPCCASRGARGLRGDPAWRPGCREGATPTPPGARGGARQDGPLAAPAPGRLLLGHLRLAETPPPPGPTPPPTPTPTPTPEPRSPRGPSPRSRGPPGGGRPYSALQPAFRTPGVESGVPAADSGGRPLPRDPDSITGVTRTQGLQKPRTGCGGRGRETGQGRKINKRRLMAAVIMAVIMDLFQLKRVDWGGVGALRGWCASRDHPESMAG
ncbi:unnamed protein product [Nyctereutes procyonoides]|uniref:(raccoon dog) hypothetical protein n=1 Tax=Nyctereutes procyonoides TaxID=34880 RepID=A0A811ZDE9_NYCPR|nr:unnamed protein product [Nyctereutes procyonoides]